MELNVSKAKLGVKRACRKCSTNFYDLNKDPIECPKCFATYAVSDFAPKHLKSASELKDKKETKKSADVFEEVLIDADGMEEDLLDDDIELEETGVDGIDLKGDESDSDR